MLKSTHAYARIKRRLLQSGPPSW